MKLIKIPATDYKTKVIIDTINQLLKELARQGIIELEDDNDGSRED